MTKEVRSPMQGVIPEILVKEGYYSNHKYGGINNEEAYSRSNGKC